LDDLFLLFGEIYSSTFAGENAKQLKLKKWDADKRGLGGFTQNYLPPRHKGHKEVKSEK
jgi:hypothetical protein